MEQDKLDNKLSNLEVKCKENADFFTRLKSRVDIALSATLPNINQNLALLRNDVERQKHMSGEMINQITLNASDNDSNSKRLYKLNEFCNEFIQIKTEAMKFSQKLMNLELKMNNEMEEMKKQIKNIEATMKMLIVDNQKNIKSFNDFKSQEAESQKNLEMKYHDSFEEFKKYVNQKIDSIQMPHMNALEREKKYLNDSISNSNEKMNKIHLDLENSLLKSGNNEMQLKLFEKKLENIYLLIKKFEMSN